MELSHKNATFWGFFWKFLERFGAQGVTFVVSIILARLLDPSTYGTIAIVSVFITILEIFVSSGMGAALIQKKDADDLDFSTLFFFNICSCSVLYLLLFLSAPFIASFYNIPELTNYIRVLGITLLISGVKNIECAYVSKHMQFKRFFFATLGGTLGAAIIGIWMAYLGFGVWALIAQSLFNNAVDTLILWLTVEWKPKKCFSFARLKGLFSYGWKLLLSDLLSNLHGEICQLIIGKRYSTEDLAYYNKAQSLPYSITSNITFSVNSVLFPAMSAIQEDKNELRAMIRRTNTVCFYLMSPLMFGMAACATPIISLLLTDKWLPCVPFMQIFCVKFALYPLNLSNLNAIKSIGRSDLILKQETTKKIVGLAILLSTIWNGVFVFALGQLLTDIVALFINTRQCKKLFNYSLARQLYDILPTVFVNLIMVGAVVAASFIPIHSTILLLTIRVCIGAIIYVALSLLIKHESFTYILATARSILRKKNKTEEKTA